MLPLKYDHYYEFFNLKITINAHSIIVPAQQITASINLLHFNLIIAIKL